MSKRISNTAPERFSDQIQTILKKLFPTWTENQIQKMVKTIVGWKKSIHQEDLVDLVNQTYLKVESKEKLNEPPGYFAKILKNKILKKLGKKVHEEALRHPEDYQEGENLIEKKTSTRKREFIQYDGEMNEQDSIQVKNAIENEFGTFDQLDSRQKIDGFFKLVLKHRLLSAKEGEFFEAMKQAALSTKQAENTSNWRKVYWEEVNQILQKSGIQVSNDYFRKIKQRVLTQLNKKISTQGRELLSFYDMEKEYVLQILLRLFESVPLPNLHLPIPAYRFSMGELEKMIWLKTEVFEKNGYFFQPNRFPEVYYCDFKEVKDFIPSKSWRDVITPDELGVYFEFFQSADGDPKNAYFGGRSREGRIVLFKDRIEAFCSRNQRFTEEDVRFVVLMHELGHWMSHWALSSGIRWVHGYHFSNSFTHEALAQLLAYWCCKGNPAQEQVLLVLSPKDDQGMIDSSKPYGAYESLKSFDEGVILQKLDQLRKFWMVTDLQMLAFIQSDMVEMAQWITATKKKANGPVWEEFVDKELAEWLAYAVSIEGWGDPEVYDPLELGEDFLKSAKDYGII
jgi:hypothetical protein